MFVNDISILAVRAFQELRKAVWRFVAEAATANLRRLETRFLNNFHIAELVSSAAHCPHLCF
jgi:hypothetical protein